MPSRELWEMAFTATPEVRLKKTGLANSQKAFIAVIVIGGMASYLYQAGNIGLAFMLGLFAFAGLLLTIRRMRMDNKPYLVISGEGLRTPGMAEVIPWANVRAIGFPEDTYDDDSLSDIRIGLRPGYTPPADPDNRRRAGFSSSDGMLSIQAGSFDKKQPPEIQRERIAAYRNAALARAVLQSRGENVRKEYSA